MWWACRRSSGARTKPAAEAARALLLAAAICLPLAGLRTAAADDVQAPGAAPAPAGISLNLKSVPVRDVLGSLAASRNLNIVVAPDVTGEVTVNLHDLGVDEALRAVLLVNGLTYVRRDGIIYVTREGSATLNGRAWIESATFRLSYADPVAVAAAIKSSLSAAGAATPYPPTRSLVVEDTPEAVDRARAVIASLDVPPRQVLIGARILEIRLDDNLGVGVDWSGLFTRKTKSLDLQQYGFALQPSPGTSGFFATLTTNNLEAFLDALHQVVDFDALAAPQVLALEGKEAQIIVGGKLGFYVTTTTQTSTVQSVEFLDIGSLLTITPTVSDDGHVVLDIHPKVSDGVVTNGLPSETTTEVTTSVLVRDGETVFIGGLLRKRDQNTRSTVPVVGRIPGANWLFGRHDDTASRTEVVVLITPRIIHPGDPDKTRPLDMEPADKPAKL